jgi:hypothetical protein
MCAVCYDNNSGPQPASFPKTPIAPHTTLALASAPAPAPANGDVAAPLSAVPSSSAAAAVNGNGTSPDGNGDSPLLPRFHYDVTSGGTNTNGAALPSGDAQASLPSSSSAGIELSAIAVERPASYATADTQQQQ